MGIAQRLRRQTLEQRLLDRARRLAGGEAGAVAYAKNMGIDRHRRLPESDVEDDIGGLAPDPGQRLEGGAIAGHDAAMALDEQPRELGEMARLGLPEPDRTDERGDALGAERRHRPRIGGGGEQRRGCAVDRGVGGLRRQNDGDQERERITIAKLGARVGVGAGEGGDEVPRRIRRERLGRARARGFRRLGGDLRHVLLLAPQT